MSLRTREVCHCDECGHEWLPSKPPHEIDQCAKCRSRKWNAGGKVKVTSRTSRTSSSSKPRNIPSPTAKPVIPAHSLSEYKRLQVQVPDADVQLPASFGQLNAKPGSRAQAIIDSLDGQLKRASDLTNSEPEDIYDNEPEAAEEEVKESYYVDPEEDAPPPDWEG